MFHMCAEQYRTAFSFFHLGVAIYHLAKEDPHKYEEAESILSMANHYDPSHAPTWAYLTVVLL